MIQVNAPDPLSLASWTTNLISTEDRPKTIWWICSLLGAVYGWSFLDLLDDFPRTIRVPKA